MSAAVRSAGLALPLVALLIIVVLFFGIPDNPDARKIAARMSDTHIVHLIGGVREAVLALPAGFDPDRAYLLIIALHGEGSNAWELDQYLRLSALSASENLALLLPQGIEDSEGDRVWNAASEGGIDDAGYLRDLVAEASEIARFESVAAVGYSDGGLMATRLACDGLPGLAAVVNFAGSSLANAQRCAVAPISLLQIHGDADEAVPYKDVQEAASRWAQRAGCDPSAAEGTPLDLDRQIDGAETAVQRWADGCAEGAIVELWTIQSGSHEPSVEEAAGPLIVDWLRSTAR